MRSTLSLAGALVLTLLTLFFATHRYILSNYYALEISQNERTISGLLQSIHAQTDFVKKIARDYAAWDDTFAFIETGSRDFINTNFRENTHTLEEFEVCGMIFLNRNNQPVWQVFSSALHAPKVLMEKVLAREGVASGGFVFLDEEIYFYDGHPITKSDASGPSNGRLLVVGKLDIVALKNQNPELIALHTLSSFVSKQNPRHFTVAGREVAVVTQWKEERAENFIHIGGLDEGQGLFAIHGREMMLQGKRALQLFLLVVSSMTTVIFLLIFFRQKEAQKEKEILKQTVALRTQDLKRTTKELELTVEKLERIAYVDELTGVQTRRSFFETIRSLLKSAAKEKKNLCVALIDLDDFKLINDTYGHGAGDLVLKDFCDACRKFLDERMLFARIGGEEFVISFYDMSLKSAEAICVKIQDYVGENPVAIDARTHVAYTFSLGMADNGDAEDIDAILRQADERLYTAKSLGKNNIRSRS